MAQKVVVLIGTKKGAFIAESTDGRRNWSLRGPYCETWPINHIVADPATGAIYGAGGNSGAAYKLDFVELHNRGNSAAALTGWSLQYTSATGTAWTNKVDLTGTIPASETRGTNTATAASGTSSASARAFKNTTAITTPWWMNDSAIAAATLARAVL